MVYSDNLPSKIYVLLDILYKNILVIELISVTLQ